MHCSIAAHSLGVVVQVVEDISADMEIEGVFGRPLKAALYKTFQDNFDLTYTKDMWIP